MPGSSALAFLWQPAPGGARLLRVFGDSPCPVLPAAIEGLPLTELGPYCFSARERAFGPDARRTGPQELFGHAIAGDFVQRVTLPGTVRVFHNAAFYNCRGLTELCLGPGTPETLSLGSDLFTNCRALERFVLDAPPDAPTGLKRLAGAVSADVGAVFAPGGQAAARVFFPEYFEYLDENTPAHIFNHSIEGEGYRMRQCFDGFTMNFDEYDSAFEQALVSESPASLCRIALDRLLCPWALRPEAAERYRACLRERAETAAAPLIARRAEQAMRLLCPLLEPADRAAVARRCAAAGWSEGAALALAHGARHTKRYDFDDL